ncbi:MAG: hypothetical protein OET18_09835 [Desulfobacterales bacterium]|nr:hypothetical protein [Desulfobacterales bacterium]
MRFLSQNILGSYNTQSTITSSSGDPYNAFSDTTKFPFISSGQDSDGDTVEINQTNTSKQSLDTIVVLASNFNDFKISTSATSGGAFSDITGTATLVISQDGFHRLYKFPSTINFFDIKFQIDDTIIADEEKQCGAILGMTELGSIDRFKAIKPKGKDAKVVNKLEAGGVSVLYKGSIHWDFEIDIDLLSSQVDVDLIELIGSRQQDFFLWINDDHDGEETVKQAPYRFQDFIRCVYTGDSSPQFYKNYLNKSASGNKFKFAQTGKINYFNPTL